MAPKGVPPLSSIPHAVYTAHLAREESVHRAPQRWAFDDLSPLHMQALRQGWVSRPVSKGMHAGHKSEMGAVKFRVMFHKFEKFRASGSRTARRHRAFAGQAEFDIKGGTSR